VKPPAFDYVRPRSLQEALDLLAAGDDIKPIAGGQSLIPLLAFRMAHPKCLVDISRLPELRGIDIGPDYLRIGAGTRWRDILSHPGLTVAHPLLVEAINHTAHYQIRNRGTVGGSCCHADPSAEMPAIALICGADFELASSRGVRSVPAAEFFVSVLTTAIEPDELLITVRLPCWPAARRYGFHELARRRGDFALAGCAVFWDEQHGLCEGPRVGVFGVAPTPLRVPEVEAVLEGKQICDTVVGEATQTLRAHVTPQADLHGTSEYRAALLEVLLERALTTASGRSS
jgi:aerobic carbon-monoxide dehydrogenase medium subunit